jgi:RND family efflux transporter MFP subunit
MAHRILVLILLVSAAATGCNNSAPPPPPMKPPDVVVSRAVAREVTDYEEFQGKTEAEKTVDVRAHVSGYLDRYNFKDGAEVRQNDVLFEIDPRPFNTELERSRAMTSLADTHVKRLEYDFQRAEALWAKNSISREDYDKAYGDLNEARSTYKAALAAQNTAQLNVTYSRVTAPISGRISRRFVDPGNMVKADDTILTRIVSLDPMYAYFDIDERTYLRIQRFHQRNGTSAGGQQQTPVEMGLSDEKGFPNKGQVDFTDNRVDPDSGSVWLRGVFPNPKKLLTGGLFVRVRLPVGERHPAVLIPEQSLATDQGQKFAWVVDDENHATYRPIQLGAQHGTLRVVEKGMSAGERVIISGLQRVRNDPKKGYAEVNVTHEEPVGDDDNQ